MSNQADHTIVRLRVPPELKKQIEESAENHNRSQSAEMVARLEDSFVASAINTNSQADIRILPLHDGKKRVIYGKLLNTLDLDYTQSLSDLKVDIELALETLSRSSIWKALQFLTKDVIVAQGNNHLNIVDNGKKGLGWLVVEDHYVDTSKKSDEI
ncbi:Arc family DNA-binding protein [Acinetobacter sp. YH12219]|uniref:Arc family DNA-binding protein n=1 Tax=Acinetobacter sp. YH12219 TaxID=2601153 RepID=UPI0015D45FD0|nr:Arc family DNA-binding protein [Acinetobacter sp. YH12219]